MTLVPRRDDMAECVCPACGAKVLAADINDHLDSGCQTHVLLHGQEPVAQPQMPLVGNDPDQHRSEKICAVCFEADNLVDMPCCGREGGTAGYCRRCLEIICQQGHGVGRCPSCRQHISIQGSIVSISERRAQCLMCRQSRIIIDRNMCDACLLGSQLPPIRYECSHCHRHQRIPHPMFRYQASPAEFGTASWACHQGCVAQTYWRIVPGDALLVPDMECPESWGRREEWLVAVRQQRHAERLAGLAPIADDWPRDRCVTM